MWWVRALPGVRRLARGARAAGARYVGRAYAPDSPRTSKAVGDVAPTYELTLSGSIDICLRQIVQMHPLRIAQERGQKHHHLHDAVADRGVLVLVAAHGGVVEPEGRQDQHVGRRGVEFGRRGAHHAGLREAAHDLVGAVVGTLEDPREAHAQAAVAAEDFDQVAIQEAVVPDRLERQVQLQPAVLEPRQAAVGRGQRVVHPCVEAREQLLDDRSEEHTSELQSLMRTSYAVFFLNKKTVYVN